MHNPIDECQCHSCALHGRTVLQQRQREIIEIYAGMEAVKLVTPVESYLMRIIEQMVATVAPAKEG